VDLVRALVMSAAAALLQSVWAQGASDVPLQVETETFHFAVTGAERGAEVSGELRLPINTPQRMPLVLILHSSPVYPEATFAWDSRLGSAPTTSESTRDAEESAASWPIRRSPPDRARTWWSSSSPR